MTRLQQALVRLETDLRQIGARWALVGGLAVSVRAQPRTTQDIDVAILVAGDREAEGVVRALRNRGYSLRLSLEHKDVDRLAAVRLTAPGEEEGGLVVDLLFASTGIEEEIVDAAEPYEVLLQFAVPVATLGHLLAMKVLSSRPERPQDLTDARALLEVASPPDLQQAREALDLIERRGFDRGKDLQAELGEILAQGSDPTRFG